MAVIIANTVRNRLVSRASWAGLPLLAERFGVVVMVRRLAMTV